MTHEEKARTEFQEMWAQFRLFVKKLPIKNWHQLDLREVYKCFPKAFINQESEMIINPKANTYFALDNIKSQFELDCKVLEYCSREALKSCDAKSKQYHLLGLSNYFQRDFQPYELDLIYSRLGNGINRPLCIKYIESHFDISVLEE